MKYLFGFVLALALGLIAAAGLVLFNPLTLGQVLPANQADRTFAYSPAKPVPWLLAHDGSLPLGEAAGSADALWESGIRGGVMAALPLSGAAGEAGAAASRISLPSPQTELLLSGVIVDDFWLITVPGEGSLFVHSVSNFWPLLRDTVVRVDWLGREWAGPARYGPTTGPTPGGGRLVGLTGRYAGSRGRVRERLMLDDYRGMASLGEISAELLIELQPPQAETD